MPQFILLQHIYYTLFSTKKKGFSFIINGFIRVFSSEKPFSREKRIFLRNNEKKYCNVRYFDVQ